MTKKRKAKKKPMVDLLKDFAITEESDGVLMIASRLDSKEAIVDMLMPYYSQLVKMYEQEVELPVHRDYRSGEETYGYASLEDIEVSLFYISDRWRAPFRMRWLIDMINPAYYIGCDD